MNNYNIYHNYLNFHDIPKTFLNLIKFRVDESSKSYKSYASSRYSVFKNLQTLFPEKSESELVKFLDINQFHSLKLRPKILVSLSHKNDFACSATIEETSNILSIGIDIEENKKLNEKAEKFFINELDFQCEKISSISLWSIKESCYKAISSYLKYNDLESDVLKKLGCEKLLLSHIKILSNNTFELYDFPSVSGSFNFKSIYENKYILSIAFLESF